MRTISQRRRYRSRMKWAGLAALVVVIFTPALELPDFAAPFVTAAAAAERS